MTAGEPPHEHVGHIRPTKPTVDVENHLGDFLADHGNPVDHPSLSLRLPLQVVAPSLPDLVQPDPLVNDLTPVGVGVHADWIERR